MVALSIPELSVHANGCVWIFACTRISLVEKRCNAGIKDFVNGKPEICNLGSIYGIYIYLHVEYKPTNVGKYMMGTLLHIIYLS